MDYCQAGQGDGLTANNVLWGIVLCVDSASYACCTYDPVSKSRGSVHGQSKWTWTIESGQRGCPNGPGQRSVQSKSVHTIPSIDCNQKHAYLNLIVTRRIQVNYCFSLRLFSGISVNLNGQELIRKKILPRYRYPYQHLLSNDCYRWDYKLTLEALYIDHIARAQPLMRPTGARR
jgi:hypothetical protein